MADPTGPILQTFPLGTQWPTIDPFLFCAHHLDGYPAGDGNLGPNASLSGRQIGSDFAGIDGWNMYHGDRVPGFPQHPHRGFETITYLRSGLCDHTDSLGAAARFGKGDTQWLTAGKGVVHAEMFPLVNNDLPNPLELFQIWLNLPAANKMVDPYFTMHWSDDTPRLVDTNSGGATTTVTAVAGELANLEAQTPPPDSWASNAEADVAIWHISMEPSASWQLPAAVNAESIRTLYVFSGSTLEIEGEIIAAGNGAVVLPDQPLQLVAGVDGVEVMMLQGRPIGEPVARYGPFVMNTEDEIRAAFDDYRATEFGGWPWPTNDPDHGHAKRFARHGDSATDTVSPNG